MFLYTKYYIPNGGSTQYICTAFRLHWYSSTVLYTLCYQIYLFISRGIPFHIALISLFSIALEI